MMRLIVYYRHDGKTEYINIPCEATREEAGIIYAYDNNNLVAAIDVGCMDIMYLSYKP